MCLIHLRSANYDNDEIPESAIQASKKAKKEKKEK